jgi:hypothetical protein
MKQSAFTSISSTLLGLFALGVAAADTVLPTYTATYEVIHKGRAVGSSEFSVSYDDAKDLYTFRSRTVVKGMMLKLVSPNAVVERSDFVVRGGEIRPLEFWYEDGSRKGEDNVHAIFDWDAGTVVIAAERRSELALQPGVLDRGSMQVAVMRDMASGAAPGPYVLADEDALKTYEYVLESEERTPTPLGELGTLRYRQQRQGSSRSTALWVAPQLQYLPVRIEQIRDGQSDTVFVLQSVQGLGAVGAASGRD